MCCATAAQAGTIAASARTHSKKTAGTGAEGCIASQSPHSAAAKGDTGEAAMRRFSSDALGPQQTVQRNGRTIAGYGSDCRTRGFGRQWALGAGS